MSARKQRFLVIGAAGYAQEVAWSLHAKQQIRGRACELLFFDDGVPTGPVASGLGEVVGSVDLVRQRSWDGAQLVMGVGFPKTKALMAQRLAEVPLRWATVLHPAALIGPNVEIGDGSYVGAGAIITVNARIGRFATINLHCQVAHDDVLGDFVTLHPDVHLSGCVTIENGCELGTGAIVIPGLTIGEGAVVGAGGVVVRSLAAGGTYVGLPARESVGPATPSKRSEGLPISVAS